MNINYEFETISAIATPLGTGGVGFTYGVFLRKTDKGSELVFDSSKYREIKQYIDSLSQHDRFSTDSTDLY